MKLISTSLYYSLILAISFCPSVLAQTNPLFEASRASLAQLNKSGTLTALLNQEAGLQVVEVYSSNSLQKIASLETLDLQLEEGQINSLYWIDDNSLAINFSDITTGVKDLLDTKSRRRLVIANFDTSSNKPTAIKEVKTDGWLIETPHIEEDVFFYAKSGGISGIYRLDLNQLASLGAKTSKLTKVDGGQFTPSNQIIFTEGYVTRWFLNGTTPSAALKYNSSNDLKLVSFDSNKKEQVHAEWSKEKRIALINSKNSESFFIPISLANKEGNFYCVDIVDSNERSVYLVDFLKNTSSLVYEASQDKVIDLLIDRDSGQLNGVRTVKKGIISDVYLSSLGAKPTTSAETLSISIDQSDDKKIDLIYKESHNLPGSYWIRNQSKKDALLASTFPDKKFQSNHQQIQSSVEVEGLSIPYLLTLPNTANKLPLIVLPHGGPIGIYDTPYFDVASQYFANNGFAVLRVNFRGSGSFGLKHKLAGEKEWGNLMLEDIRRATLTAANHSRINPEKICVVGFSYGGYAAAMLTIQHPNIYQCGVTIAGPTDLPLLINSFENSERRRQWLTQQLADPESDYDQLKAISPAFMAHHAKNPMFIIHGDQDDTVDVEHAHRLITALKKEKKTVQFYILPNVGHQFSDPIIATDVFNRIRAFTLESLGKQSISAPSANSSPLPTPKSN